MVCFCGDFGVDGIDWMSTNPEEALLMVNLMRQYCRKAGFGEIIVAPERTPFSVRMRIEERNIIITKPPTRYVQMNVPQMLTYAKELESAARTLIAASPKSGDETPLRSHSVHGRS
jgi:hypothetical protein